MGADGNNGLKRGRENDKVIQRAWNSSRSECSFRHCCVFQTLGLLKCSTIHHMYHPNPFHTLIELRTGTEEGLRWHRANMPPSFSQEREAFSQEREAVSQECEAIN
jgi:hypothetical protein